MLDKEKKLDWKKHILIFFITLLIFSSGFFLSNFFFEKRIVQIRDLQQDLTIDILSLETQFSILTQIPCEKLNEVDLTQQLSDVSQKLTSIGHGLGQQNPDFLRFKKYYSILETRYLLLLEKAAKECNSDLVSAIYFYSDEKKCPECENQSYVLSYLAEKYPFLRIYSFDYNLSLSVIQSLKSIYSLKNNLPITIINDKVYYGFQGKKNLEEILNQYIDLKKSKFKIATSTAATTKKR
jgi:hypothetical protein